MSVVDTTRLLEERTKKAAGLIALLRREKEELQQRFDIVRAHNAELEEYVESYTTSNKLLEQSIAVALDTLSAVDGLDEVELFDDLSAELDAVDAFTSGDALATEDIDVDALLSDL
ncbi:MAG TPA: hypothetical protein VFC80_07255 [Sphaerochaeta sp.]|nr:hypothetical protein [Sphaerochaeta sp.]